MATKKKSSKLAARVARLERVQNADHKLLHTVARKVNTISSKIGIRWKKSGATASAGAARKKSKRRRGARHIVADVTMQ